MTEENKVVELNEEELEDVSGGVAVVQSLDDIIVGKFYTVSGHPNTLFRVDAKWPGSTGTMIVCGIYDYDFIEDRATNTKSSTTNYGVGSLKPHSTPLEVIVDPKPAK